MGTQKFGVIGLGVMGQNIALNVERNGFPVSVYNRTTSKMEEFVATHGEGRNLIGQAELQDFVASLERPRRILIMVQAGKATQAVIDQIAPFLEDGDILIDGGNAHFPDTERRAKDAEDKPYNFFGMGISGGEEGALWGPSLMPGGARSSYNDLEPILTKIAAKTDSGPCVTWCGHNSAGHFVKMVHNGIEYGDMQLIAEAYDILRNLGGIESGDEMASIFTDWNDGELQSFLIEITSQLVNHKDAETGDLLVNKIKDAAAQKGTGKWTSQAALDLGVPIPTITAAVDGRLMSALFDQRHAAAKVLSGVKPATLSALDKAAFVEDVRLALYAAKVCSYAQGMALIGNASKEFGYETNLGETARIWKGGCIIRAVFLDKIKSAFDRNASLPNLMMDAEFAQILQNCEAAWRRVVTTAVNSGLAVPALSASLAYYDTYRRARGPAYIIQAQRDFFGAHTFERLDKPGSFHENWTS
ncbi:MAG: NADP-dependent phosphogluconate dehydrogenase [Sumerlaeia bacterium]